VRVSPTSGIDVHTRYTVAPGTDVGADPWLNMGKQSTSVMCLTTSSTIIGPGITSNGVFDVIGHPPEAKRVRDRCLVQRRQAKRQPT
jgi:hypothetical protein